MPARRRPLRGSRGYYPKKRAKRIYARVRRYPHVPEAKPLGFAGYKAGMTHAFIVDTNPKSKSTGQEIFVPATVVECPPLTVFGFRCYDSSRSLCTIMSNKISNNLSRKMRTSKQPKSFEEQAKHIPHHFSYMTLLCHTNPQFKKKPEVFELRIGGDTTKQLEYAKHILGKEIKISEIFKPGDYVDVIAVTKGKGTQGPVKRFGIRILGRKFQQMHRHTGSLGPREPGKIRSTVAQAGQLRFQTRTELNKRILKIADGKEFNPVSGFVNFGVVSGDSILLEGSIPGPKKRLVRLRYSIRPLKSRYPAELRAISLHSQQGV